MGPHPAALVRPVRPGEWEIRPEHPNERLAMKNVLQSVIAAACLLLIAVPARAQVPAIDVRLNPRIGLYEPLSDLGEFQETASTITAEQSGSLALGLGVELELAVLPVGVRLNLDYATGSEISQARDLLDSSLLRAPVERTLLAVVGDVIFRPLPKIVVFQPYLFAGGGLKQYDFEPTGADPAATFEDESDPTLHLGGGLDVGVGPLALNAELGDYISWYQIQEAGDSEMQHDLFVTIGFSIGLL